MQRVELTEELSFSRIVYGLWRLSDWDMSTKDLVVHIENCLKLGITTFDLMVTIHAKKYLVKH